MWLVAGTATEVDITMAAGFPLGGNFRMTSITGDCLAFDRVREFRVGALSAQSVATSAVNRHGTVLADAPQFVIILVTVFAGIG